jgi:2-C-methyl-D-erythritol 2,4-cyclodiphosphate synthase
MIKIRSGIGYDIHRLVPGHGLMIGGIRVADTLQAQAHSDGDVLIHSLIDALLGAMGQPDIGELFPDSDPAYQGIAGSVLLGKVRELLHRNHFEILNLDCVLIIESPKIAPFKKEIIKNISGILGIPGSDFNVKAKTKEKLDAVGRGEALECFSMAMIRCKEQK